MARHLSQSNATPYLVYAKNNGDGTFEKPILTPLTVISPYSFIVGDFNNDGKLDLLFLRSACNHPANLSNARADALSRERRWDFPARHADYVQPHHAADYGVLMADVNGDGKPDLLVSGNGLISSTDQNAMYELIGNGDGTFQAPKLLFSNPGSTSYFATADLNHDGIPDLVEVAVNTTDVNRFPRTLRTYLGKPGGSSN